MRWEGTSLLQGGQDGLTALLQLLYLAMGAKDGAEKVRRGGTGAVTAVAGDEGDGELLAHEEIKASPDAACGALQLAWGLRKKDGRGGLRGGQDLPLSNAEKRATPNGRSARCCP